MAIGYLVVILLVGTFYTQIQGQTQNVFGKGCPNQKLTGLDCAPPGVGALWKDVVMSIQSITVYATTNTSLGNNSCGVDKAECQRVVRSATDAGLSDDYKYFYNWMYYLCQGKTKCDITLPPSTHLVGENQGSIPQSLKTCPPTGTKYFTSILVHVECKVGAPVSTVSAPADTTPRTEPTTPTTTLPYAVFVAILAPGMNEREKIILGIAIAIAIVLLIALLLALYCWERWRNEKKFAKLLRLLGRPQEQEGYDEAEDAARPDAWKDDVNNMDALGEYTGVKPDEFLTIDRKTMEKSGLIFNESIGGVSTMPRGNVCSTLNRSAPGYERPNVQRGPAYDGPINYETDENLELEKRMATVYGREHDIAEDDGEAVTQH